jgi:glycine/D-amino acid oxidase-like deaminating enzyme
MAQTPGITVTGDRFWMEELDEAERISLDPGPRSFHPRPDVLVVGGGIMGVAIAASCQGAGISSVLLIESRHLGAGTTSGAAGLLLPDTHHGRDPAPLVDLGRASLDRWRLLEENIPGGIGLIDVDWIGLAPHEPAFLADPPPSARWLEDGDLRRVVPSLGVSTSAALIAHQARLNPLRALARLAQGLAHVTTGVAATGVTIKGGRLTSVSTTSGAVSPGVTVFATGNPPILDGLDVRLPGRPVKGHLLVTAPSPVRLPGIVADVATPLPEGRHLVGGTLDIDDDSPAVREEVIARLRDSLAVALPPTAGLPITHRWCCWRPHHPDGLPVIDRLRGIDNAWVTSGHYRTGILMGPATGALMAEWIMTGGRPAAANAFAMSRFADHEN